MVELFSPSNLSFYLVTLIVACSEVHAKKIPFGALTKDEIPFGALTKDEIPFAALTKDEGAYPWRELPGYTDMDQLPPTFINWKKEIPSGFMFSKRNTDRLPSGLMFSKRNTDKLPSGLMFSKKNTDELPFMFSKRNTKKLPSEFMLSKRNADENGQLCRRALGVCVNLLAKNNNKNDDNDNGKKN